MKVVIHFRDPKVAPAEISVDIERVDDGVLVLAQTDSVSQAVTRSWQFPLDAVHSWEVNVQDVVEEPLEHAI